MRLKNKYFSVLAMSAVLSVSTMAFSVWAEEDQEGWMSIEEEASVQEEEVTSTEEDLSAISYDFIGEDSTGVICAEQVVEDEEIHVVNADAKDKVEAEVKKDYADYAALKLLADNKDNYIEISDNTATCLEDGTATVTFICMDCGQPTGETITVKTEKLGHLPYQAMVEVKVQATCEKPGSCEVVTQCPRCGAEDPQTPRRTVSTPRLKHTNEEDVLASNVGVLSEKDTGAYIKFFGNGDYNPLNMESVGKTYIGYSMEAKAYTNCEVCHNNEQLLKGVHNPVVITVTAIKEQDDAGAGYIKLKATYVMDDGKHVVSEETCVPYFSSVQAYEDRIETEAINGLHMDKDYAFRYYVDGKVDQNYNGIVNYGGKEYFVANGELCRAMGMNEFGGKWYYLFSGEIKRGYTGLALYDDAWFYLTNGELSTIVNGLVPYDGGTFLFAEGRLCNEVNGLWQDSDGTWYFLALGQVQIQHTGVAMYDGEFFYIRDGKLASDFNGTIEYDGATFNVVAGQLYDKID